MNLKHHLIAAVTIFGTLLGGEAAPADVFHFQCAKLPFPVVTQSRAIDAMCGIAGDQTAGPKALQNSLKNNLCRSGEITIVQQGDFVALQSTVSERGIKFGHSGFGESRLEFFPDDRASLTHLITVNGRAIGEGAYVQFAAYMDNPHYSDTSSGESVNCMIPGNPTNDIHINLVQQPAPSAPSPHDPNHDALAAARDRALCQAVVAEVIPHYRPAVWEQEQLRTVANQQIPVRISGQLFFDASHFPCNGDEPQRGESLRRASLWEIHPVYSIDVCRETTLRACRADDEAAWVPLDQWVQVTVSRRR
jgi:hypothetical protein